MSDFIGFERDNQYVFVCDSEETPVGKVRVPGHDYGSPGLEVKSTFDDGKYLVVKWHGHSAFAGRGASKYFPTHYAIFQLEESNGNKYSVRNVTGWYEFGRQARIGMAILKAKLVKKQ